MHLFLICYDISSNKIRGRVFRLLKKKAVPLQESVFIYRRTRAELLKIERYIAGLIAEDDSLIVMPCCEKCYARSRVYTKKQENLLIC